ncbi:MAG: sigma-54-dependent Fis family transcriptional regulator [Polyangiaceae bacterium]|nr:sigma-54-dependent Fis family transcriptional regulator [Polyangiaceae bacterium]
MKAPPGTRGILIVDDSRDTLEVLERNLAGAGYPVVGATSAAEALERLERQPVDLVITDLKMPKVGGLEVVRYVRENLRDTEVMMITGYPSVEGAVVAVKTGAEEYLGKPFTSEELLAAVERALEKLQLRRLGRGTLEEVPVAPCGIMGTSTRMRKVLNAIGKAACTSATVLITGESGTGKELVARAIHYSGRRAAAPFVPVNCGGIPEGLVESALFGHMKGAFTGAAEARAGFFHAADGGSLFLDEVREMSPAMQVKLLRVLQDCEVWMVGSSRPRKVDARILAATNIDLASLVKAGAFREDLFYRLNVITIAVPPLRERGDDVLLLARHFAAACSNELGRPIPRFSDGVLRVFKDHSWPGNVRELENVVRRLVVMSEGDLIEVPDLPSVMRFSLARANGSHRTLAEVEASHICDVLAAVGGNKTKAAAILGIDRKTLREKLKSLGAPSCGMTRVG